MVNIEWKSVCLYYTICVAPRVGVVNTFKNKREIDTATNYSADKDLKGCYRK